MLTRRELLVGMAIPVLQGQEEPVFKSDVKVVNILANVLTKNHEIVRDLGQDDFTVLENGHPQVIRYFAKQSDLPLTIGLMVDTSMSQRRVLDAERGASYRFIDQVLRETKDHVFILQFDINVMIKQGLTASRKDLDAALDFVDTPTKQQLRAQMGGGTLLYDAIVSASTDILKAQTGRKALVILTDGVDFGSDASVATAIEAAQRADTLIYTIMFSDTNGTEGRGVLQRLSKETGAGAFEVTKKQGIEAIFSVIEDELRSQYSIGYVSDTPVRISEFRKLQVIVKPKGYLVQARDRYWARR